MMWLVLFVGLVALMIYDLTKTEVKVKVKEEVDETIIKIDNATGREINIVLDY